MMEIRIDANGRKYEYYEESVKNETELERLRAEVASLKADTERQLVAIAQYDEENASLKEEQQAERKDNKAIHEAAANMRLVIAGRLKQIDELKQQNADLTQQLASANGRVDKLADVLTALIAHTLECEKQLDEFHGLGSDAGSGCSVAVCNARAALSAQNVDS